MDEDANARIEALERKIDALLQRPAPVSPQAFCVICSKVIDPNEGQSPSHSERIYYLTRELQPRHPHCNR